MEVASAPTSAELILFESLTLEGATAPTVSSYVKRWGAGRNEFRTDLAWNLQLQAHDPSAACPSDCLRTTPSPMRPARL